MKGVKGSNRARFKKERCFSLLECHNLFLIHIRARGNARKPIHICHQNASGSAHYLIHRLHTLLTTHKRIGITTYNPYPHSISHQIAKYIKWTFVIGPMTEVPHGTRGPDHTGGANMVGDDVAIVWRKNGGNWRI
ncbi:unnamed protein product [Sphenostylis stenocarpa]|uniref:Uncharacterized protein n=1 Tax=Sphenostylis stenocarpa TaxID=92480 RepID=A0AA86SDD2_9FABA|nr:unnamed protein product [Sphenostylis stenocarpa]